MRILFVAMANSVHTARWLSQLAGRGWDLHLFPSTDSGIDVHPDLAGVTVHHAGWRRRPGGDGGVRLRGVSLYRRAADAWKRRMRAPDEEGWMRHRARGLLRLIGRIRPDIVHSMEIQHGGYLVLEARKAAGGRFPPWIVTNWGSDIYLFGRLAAHAPRIREVLGTCDYYSCECRRDVCLARAHGLKGKVLDVIPNAGGYDLAAASALRAPGPVSGRRGIMLKGYQGWAGRALVGLRALERCADALAGYEIVVYSATPDVEIAAELLGRSAGVPVTVVPKGMQHDEILRLHGKARLSIGLSISDAISTSLLEALVMGSFPIQSWTACADEWIEDGETGILVPPDDPDVAERAVRRVLGDDGLVDGAAERNFRLARERLDRSVLMPRVAGLYETVAAETGLGQGGTS